MDMIPYAHLPIKIHEKKTVARPKVMKRVGINRARAIPIQKRDTRIAVERVRSRIELANAVKSMAGNKARSNCNVRNV